MQNASGKPFQIERGMWMRKEKQFLMKPKNDFCFKELMEDEAVRCGFVAAVLKVTPEEIAETKLLSTILRKGHEEEKQGILDVRVLLSGGEQIDIEIQIAPVKFWAERSVFYLCKMYAEQIHAGEGYEMLQKCIHVGILDFILFPGCREFYSSFHLWEDSRREKYTEKLELHTLELPKLSRYAYTEGALLNWARFLNAEGREEMEMAAKSDTYIEKAYERLTRLSADEQKRLEYEAREKAIRDYDWGLKSSWMDGHTAGHAVGRELGLAEGIGKGIKLTKRVLELEAQGMQTEEIAAELEVDAAQVRQILEY